MLISYPKGLCSIPTQNEIYQIFFSKPFIYFVYRDLPEKYDVNPSIFDVLLLFALSDIFGAIAWSCHHIFG